MDWRAYVFGAAVVIAPWIGIAIVVVLQGHLAERVRALEEKTNALIGELGWKEK